MTSLSGTPSRRTFLQGSSAVLLTSTLEPAPGGARSTDLLRIALVGCGGRGTGAAIQALSTTGPVHLVAMADAFRDRLDSSLAEIVKAASSNVASCWVKARTSWVEGAREKRVERPARPGRASVTTPACPTLIG